MTCQSVHPETGLVCQEPGENHPSHMARQSGWDGDWVYWPNDFYVPPPPPLTPEQRSRSVFERQPDMVGRAQRIAFD